MRTIFAFISLWVLLPALAVAEGTWIKLKNQASEGIGTLMLLSDGTVMAQGVGGGFGTTNWYRLTPDNTGGYTNGTWSTRAAASYSRLYFTSVVLQDGRVFMAGAEYGNGTTNAEIYNPFSDSWKVVPVPSGLITTNNTITSAGANQAGFIDSAGILLSTGNVLITPVSPANPGYTVLFHPGPDTFSQGPKIAVGNNEDEASLVKLPDDSILTIDFASTTSERYIPSLNQWIPDAVVPDSLYDTLGFELGAAFMLPNRTAFFIGSKPNTAIYTPSGGTAPGSWIAGPTIPNGLGAPDAPASMMRNGKILCALSPTPYVNNGTNVIFTTPTSFYEYDYSAGVTGTFTQVHAPNGSFTNAGPTFVDRFLNLPDGTILFAFKSSQLYVYQPDGSSLAAGKPVIQNALWQPDGSIQVIGTQLNGISQGSAYGDDVQNDSNYPITRFVDTSGHVSYGTSYDWSSTGVMTGSRQVTTESTGPGNLFLGPGIYTLDVVANGISSDPFALFGPLWVDFNLGGAVGSGTFSSPFGTLSQGTNAVINTGTIILKPGHLAQAVTISKPMIITSSGGAAVIGQ